MEIGYIPPLSLTILGAIFLLLGAICSALIALDIVIKRGWRTMMWIMIPTYIVTALYFGPAGIWLYWRYGRPKEPVKINENHEHMHHHPPDHSEHMHHQEDQSEASHKPMEHNMHQSKITTPFYVSVLVGVTHCGAGCVLGDIVGEWIIYGTNVMINGRNLWPEMLIDYAFALFFGIFFQYFSIAPMSGEWGIKTFFRAAKADIASLTAFEIGLFGWMAIYQIAIWDWKLGMLTTVYWWMMQVGMILGFLTAFPMNWVLLKYGIKEPHVM